LNFRYPIFLDLAGKKCLVIGEGHEIAGKIKALVDALANVIYVNPRAEPVIQELAAAGLVRWEARHFQPDDLAGCFLVITHLDDNSEVFRLAEERRVLCNAVDDPQHCRFSYGSVHRQGDLTIGISTNGWAPALAVRLKQQLEKEVGPEYGELLDLIQVVRPEIKARIPDFGARRELWYRIVDSDILARLREGQRDAAGGVLRRMIEHAANSISRSDTSERSRNGET
jgi:siroheme synthase-like protein